MDTIVLDVGDSKTCPFCGWESKDDSTLIKRTRPEYLFRDGKVKSAWKETHQCPECSCHFRFQIYQTG
jgi:hypothetical protein